MPSHDSTTPPDCHCPLVEYKNIDGTCFHPACLGDCSGDCGPIQNDVFPTSPEACIG